MNWDLIMNSVVWVGIAVWTMRECSKYQRNSRAYRAISKGYRFSEKYRLLKRLR